MALIDRTAAAGLLADQNINEILKEATAASAALATFRTVRMGTKIAKLPILTVLPTASWLDGDTARKPTSTAGWDKKTLTAEAVGVIVPIPEDVFDDTAFNVWNEVRPLIAQSLGAAVDKAVFFGTNAPASFDPSLVEGANAANQDYSESSTGDLVEDINQTWALVEAGGNDVNVQYASRRIRSRLRGLRATTGDPIYLDSLRNDGSAPAVMGEDLVFVQNGAWNSAAATLIAGDRTKAIIGVRSDVKYTLLDQATLTDGSGNVTYSLAEQDMVALRAVFRMGFVVADPIQVDTGGAAARTYPFAVLTPVGS